MRGGTAAQSTLSFGVFVIVAFALLFLFYCNSFLVRRRYKEFGLYSILGMNKHNISRILAWETLLTALLSLIGGIFIGALLSKLAEMIFLHMLGGTADYSLHISLPAIKYMLLYFGGIFALIYISSLIKLHRSTAVELVHSESYGEKPVKANPVLGIAGVILLSAAYILAVSIKEPCRRSRFSSSPSSWSSSALISFSYRAASCCAKFFRKTSAITTRPGTSSPFPR